MKIVIVGTFPPFRGGIAHFYATLARELSGEHEVQAVNFTTQYPGPLFPGKTQYEAQEPASGFPNRRLLSSINPVTWIRTAIWIRKQQPDLIIFKYWMPFFGPAFGYLARRFKKESKTRIVVVCDNIIPHESRWFDLPATKYFFNAVDRFIVMSKSVESDLLSLYPDAEYQRTHHPLYNIFGSPVDMDTARRHLSLKSDKIILFFGFVRGYKGLDVLIKSAARLEKELNDFQIVAAGDCYEDKAKYTDLVTECGVDDIVDLRLEFIPDQDVAHYFSAADVVVLPYKTATQSGIVPIAYHFNRPVIVTRVGGLPEIVKDGETGFLSGGEPDEIADSISKFYKKLSGIDFEANIESHKKRYSWREFAKVVIGEDND